MNFLGLDISTSITGATILDEFGNILYCEAWDLRNQKKFPSFYEKIEFVHKKLLKIYDGFQPDFIFIEDSLLSFKKGSSSAGTIAALAKMNGAVSALVFLIMGKRPSHSSASKSRKICGVVVPRGQKPKPIVLEWVLSSFPHFEVKKTRTGSIAPGNYDRADSLVVAYAGWKEWKQTN